MKVTFEPFKLKRRTIAWAAGLVIRKKRGYRMLDHFFTLGLLGFAYPDFPGEGTKVDPEVHAEVGDGGGCAVQIVVVDFSPFFPPCRSLRLIFE